MVKRDLIATHQLTPLIRNCRKTMCEECTDGNRHNNMKREKDRISSDASSLSTSSPCQQLSTLGSSAIRGAKDTVNAKLSQSSSSSEQAWIAYVVDLFDITPCV